MLYSMPASGSGAASFVCRWDQVALVRQYRDGFGTDEGGPKGRGAGARLPAEEYEARLAEILKRQQAALKADEPVVTDTEDELQHTPPTQLQNADATAAQQQQHQGGTAAAGEDVADALFAGCDDSDHEVGSALLSCWGLMYRGSGIGGRQEQRRRHENLHGY